MTSDAVLKILLYKEAALYAEFSMKDHLMYFGKLHGMSKEKIEERTEFLVQLLNLPNPNKLARELRLFTVTLFAWY